MRGLSSKGCPFDQDLEDLVDFEDLDLQASDPGTDYSLIAYATRRRRRLYSSVRAHRVPHKSLSKRKGAQRFVGHPVFLDM